MLKDIVTITHKKYIQAPTEPLEKPLWLCYKTFVRPDEALICCGAIQHKLQKLDPGLKSSNRSVFSGFEAWGVEVAMLGCRSGISAGGCTGEIVVQVNQQHSGSGLPDREKAALTIHLFEKIPWAASFCWPRPKSSSSSPDSSWIACHGVCHPRSLCAAGASNSVPPSPLESLMPVGWHPEPCISSVAQQAKQNGASCIVSSSGGNAASTHIKVFALAMVSTASKTSVRLYVSKMCVSQESRRVSDP